MWVLAAAYMWAYVYVLTAASGRLILRLGNVRLSASSLVTKLVLFIGMNFNL